MTGWQPIKTAPKDKPILVLLKYSHVMMAGFNIMTFQWEIVGYSRSDGLRKKCLEKDVFEKQFTHWMPLPEPPKGE
jgi:hypothetical protein